MSESMTVYERLADNMAALEKMGEHFVRSGLFGADKIAQGIVLALECACQRKSPSQLLRRWHLVEGKLSLKATAALADLRQAGGAHKWLEMGDEAKGPKDEQHYAEGWFKSPEGIEMTYRYSMADARKEGLVKDKSRWTKRPGQMLRARVTSNAIAALAPEVYAGDVDTDDDAPEAAPVALDLAAAVKAPEVTPPVPAKALAQPVEVLPAVKAPTPVAPVAPVIDVKATVTTEPPEDLKELAEKGLAPVTPAPAVAAPAAAQTAPPAPAAVAPSRAADFERVNKETYDKLVAILDPDPAYYDAALAYIRRAGMVKPDGAWKDLSQKAAQRIVNNTESFRVATGYQPKGAA